MMEIETKGAGPKERREMRMKQEEKRDNRWEEKLRRFVLANPACDTDKNRVQ